MEKCSNVHLGARRLMGADTLMTGYEALLGYSVPAINCHMHEVCRKYLRKVSRVRGSAGAIESRSREWASTNLKPEATFVSVSFPTHTEREDEEDLADRCRFDRSTRGSLITVGWMNAIARLVMAIDHMLTELL